MTDIEKLIAKGTNAICVETITTKRTFYNCFGEKIDEAINEKTCVYTFREGAWITGLEERKN